jgi:hypothetical protein
VEIFRFDIEVEGPSTTEHFLRLCEYVSMMAPYSLLGSIYALRGDEDVRLHLSYDALINLKLEHSDIKSMMTLILAALSEGLMLLVRRAYEVAVGNFEVLENKDLFVRDLEQFGRFNN